MSVSNREAKKSGLWIDLPRHDRSYNETTVVELWIHQNKRYYAFLLDACRMYKNIDYCASILQEHFWIELDTKVNEPSLWSDLMTAGFARVNWQEIIRRHR